METAFKTDCGKIRSHNEDSGGVFPKRSDLLLAVVADGMGGHRAGDVASALALDCMKSLWEKVDSLDSQEEARQWLSDAIKQTNTYVLSYAAENPECQGMGTTVVAALCSPDFLTIAHVGDSRGYLLTQHDFVQVTKDHSLVGELVRQGQISEKEAELHPRKHVLLQAVGTEQEVESEPETFAWNTENIVLLCSDGLTNNVSGEQLERVLRSDSKTLQEKADRLTELANSAGGDDNITLILVRLTVDQEVDDASTQEDGGESSEKDDEPSMKESR